MEQDKKLKKINSFTKLLLISLSGIFFFPLIIHFLFKIKVPENWVTVAVWHASDMLEYGGSIISSLIVFLTVFITLKKNKEENDKIIQNSQLEKKFEKYTNLSSEILPIFNNLFNDDYEKICSGIYDQISYELARQNLVNHFTELRLKIYALQLFIPIYIRPYFDKMFINNFKIYQNQYNSVLFGVILDKNEIIKDFNSFKKYTKDFFNLSQKNFLFFADYYFNKEFFSVNGYKDILEKFNEY